MLSPDQITQLKAGMNLPTSTPSLTQPATHDWVDSLIGISPNTTQSLSPGSQFGGSGSIGESIANTFKQGGQNVTQDVQNTQPNAQQAGNTPLAKSASVAQTAGHIAGDVAGTAGGLIGDVVSPIIPDTVKTKIGDVSKFITDKVNSIPGMTPDIAKSLSDVFNTLTLKGGAETAPVAENAVKSGIEASKPLVESATQAIKDTTGKIKEAMTPVVKPMDEAKVSDLYNRAIRPTVVGKSTAGQVTKASDQVISGAKAIVDNKPNLEFTDMNGEKISGQSPKSVDQFSQAIQQTKTSIFNKYNDLAKQAGEQGISVDASTIGKELQPVIDSKSLAIANPKAVAYAQGIQSRLEQAGGIDAQTAQDVIQHYNESLKAFYKNPTYDTASNASIDSLVANKFREQLDKGITGATGKEYQALKNQYGALSSMEKDVAHRNIVWGRQNKVGLASNIANISSGAELIKGLATLNPVDLAVGTGIKGAQLYMKYLNNPDVGVSRLFSEIEKGGPSSIESTQAQAGSDIKSGSYQQPSTSSPKVKGEIPKSTLPKDTSLKGDDVRVQDASIAKYDKNPQALTDQYLKINGKVVNTDEARKLFSDIGYNGTNSAAVQEASSAVAKDSYRQLLNTSKEPDALILAGGSGTGKTTGVNNVLGEGTKNAGVILDGNLSSMKSADARIQEAKDAGKNPKIVYVYRDPADAWENGVISRMINNKAEGGRVVPLSVFMENHEGSLNVVKNIIKDQKAPVTLIDNSLGQNKQQLMNMDKFNKISYDSSIKDKLLSITKNIYDQGKITKEQYEALIK